jgi:hypothetical protein
MIQEGWKAWAYAVLVSIGSYGRDERLKPVQFPNDISKAIMLPESSDGWLLLVHHYVYLQGNNSSSSLDLWLYLLSRRCNTGQGSLSSVSYFFILRMVQVFGIQTEQSIVVTHSFGLLSTPSVMLRCDPYGGCNRVTRLFAAILFPLTWIL